MEIDIVQILVWLAIILVSMVLHELAHGLVAYWLGDDTAKVSGRLSLNPLRHIDWFMSVLLPLMLAIAGGPIFGGAKPVPINTRRLKWDEWGFALVAIAGPLTNFILAFISFAILTWFGGNMPTFVFWVVLQAVMINLGFMVFNLLPIPPLDGSRVLYALAPQFIREQMIKMEQFGIIVVLVLIMVTGSLLGQLMMTAVSGILQLFQMVLGGA